MDVSSPFLQGHGVVVTRPAAQADGLCRAIESAGGRPIRFPAMEIRVLESPEDRHRLANANAYDLLIYVSANAVRFGAPPSPPGALLAIGNATRQVLEEQGFAVSAHPKPPYDSEALLELPGLQKVRGQRILIVRGLGGREHLARALRERGAVVEYAQVYRRALPDRDEAELAAEWMRGGVHVITVTSVEILENLMRMLSPVCQALLRATPLVAASRRVLQKARALGFALPVTLAADPGDHAMAEAAGQALVHLPN